MLIVYQPVYHSQLIPWQPLTKSLWYSAPPLVWLHNKRTAKCSTWQCQQSRNQQSLQNDQTIQLTLYSLIMMHSFLYSPRREPIRYCHTGMLTMRSRLKLWKNPPMGRTFSILTSELQEIWKWIEENLSKCFIGASSSSCASPIRFVQKKDGSLRLCVD